MPQGKKQFSEKVQDKALDVAGMVAEESAKQSLSYAKSRIVVYLNIGIFDKGALKMPELANFFGFTGIVSSLWNAAAYLAFVGIIFGVIHAKYRNTLIVLGAAILATYAGFFLHNTLFVVLQILVCISGLLKWIKVPKRVAIFIGMTICAYLYLTFIGAILDVWALIGSFGLLGIAFGLAMLPKQYGFLVMAAGGVLLVFYAFAVEAWVFFFLNIFFAAANIYTWRKSRR